MQEYDPELGDAASMARVAEAGAMEVRAGRGPIDLDMAHFDADRVRKLRRVLPLPARIMERAGVLVGDRMAKNVEWAPTFFGTIAAGGGVLADTNGETSVSGLFACGDAMARSKHFPKALSGAAVTGKRAGTSAAHYAGRVPLPEPDRLQLQAFRVSLLRPFQRKQGVDVEQIILGVQETLLPYEITVISRGDRLERAVREMERLRDEEVPLLHASDAHSLRLAHEVDNMVLVGEMYLRSRLLREESRDGALREDFPCTDNVQWLKWTTLQQGDGKMNLGTVEIPGASKFGVRMEKVLHPVFEVARKKGIRWG